MRARLVLAHTALLCSLVGCAESHGRGADDAGPTARDAGPILLDASVVASDAGAPHPPVSCEPDDAFLVICPESPCDGLPTWHWNGDSCFSADCGACEGDDCRPGWLSREECESAHARCQAPLCRSSGGEWQWWAQECGHYACGVLPPLACLVGQAVCRCGDDEIFDPELGCVEAECPKVDPLSRQVVCESTGGLWAPICCDAVCGERCAADCATMACDCGVGRVFDVLHGCIESARCFERRLGESCDTRGARCEDGTICCSLCRDRIGDNDCGTVCRVPECDTEGPFDECGHYLGDLDV